MRKILTTVFLVITFVLPSFAQHLPTLMNLSAHPDDEDGATLAYYRYKYGVKTYSVCFTRGEGGQNEIGPELYADLGVLRTVETERASHIIGSELYFLNFVDFGFSKTAKETFDIWGKDETVARLVYIIRKLKPDVLFTNHDSTSGHGNHQAVGIAALEAFSLAANPSYHPEQLKEPGVGLFQPKKLFMRVFSQRDTSVKVDVIIPVSADMLPLGKTATQLAVEALAQHRTQGMDKIVANGRFGRFLDSTRYVLVRESAKFENDPNDFFGGLHTPDEIHLPLIPYRPALRIDASDSILVRNQKFTIEVDHSAPISHLQTVIRLPVGWTSSKLDEKNKDAYRIVVGSNAQFTYPKVRHLYETFRTEPPITVDASFDRSGKEEHESDPVFIDIAPAQTISLSSAVYRIEDEPLKIPYLVKNYFPNKSAGRVTALVPKGWEVVNNDFVIGREDSIYTDSVTVIPPHTLPEGNYSAEVCINGDTARATLKKFNVLVSPGLNVGIVQSYDDVFSRALDEIKVKHRLLVQKDLVSGDLQQYSAIVIDIRAYLVRPDLVKNNARLLDYVKKGGLLIVMYQKTEDWRPEYAPYPFSISRNRITYENAPVTVLSPEHPIFNAPNKITPAAWEGWVQERSLYMPSNVPIQYERLISAADPGEQQLDTGLLLASYGEGKYLYTSYVWYRELKELNEGAYRIFANMISLAAKK